MRPGGRKPAGPKTIARGLSRPDTFLKAQAFPLTLPPDPHQTHLAGDAHSSRLFPPHSRQHPSERPLDRVGISRHTSWDGAAISASARPHVCSRIWKLGSAEDYARIFGGSGRTGPIASKNYAVVACQSSMQRLPPVRRRLSGACPDTRRSNKPCATTISTHSVCPDSLSLPKLNPVEPPWYGPVCPVVGEGWHREVSPYPDQSAPGS
jgi:hypothetical protein